MFTSSILLALGAVASVSAKPCTTRPSGASPTSAPSGASTNAPATGAVQCPVVLEGRVPSTAVLTDFDSAATSPFNPDYVKGNNLSWSEILLFPEGVAASRFDAAGGFQPIEVTVNNASIFMEQYGFRRAGLQFANDTNEASPGYMGVKTLHWSVKQDAERALNTSHEYLNVWHEAADYSANQFLFQTGKMIDQPDLDADTFKFFDRNMTLLWETPIDQTEWQNFALTLDIDANTVQIYYSLGDATLAAVTEVIDADLSGEGQFQLGMIKKPTGTSDVVNAGYQEAPFEEGQIYGGIFVEDSTGGCISL